MNTGTFTRILTPLALFLFFTVSYPDICVSCTPGEDDCFHHEYKAKEPSDTLRFDELYYAQPHNSYAHSGNIFYWLKAGYRSVEIDVHDRANSGDWNEDETTVEEWWNGAGPHVGHDKITDPNNCGGDRLGHCFESILEWRKGNTDHLPLLVFIDMKARSPEFGHTWSNDWTKADIRKLDEFISESLKDEFLNDLIYGYKDLLAHLKENYLADPDKSNVGDNYREKLKKYGWPTVDSLRGRIIVVLNGGPKKHNLADLGDPNHNYGQEQALFHIGPENTSVFMCPDVDASDPEEISGKIDSIDEDNSGYFLCANLEAGDHYQKVANEAAEYKQILHLWGSAGDFENWDPEHGTDYATSFIAVAHGISVIGWDVPHELNFEYVGNEEHFTPGWTDSIPLVGKRRSLPGYFQLRTQSDDSRWMCLDIEGSTYANGSAIQLWECDDNKKSQKFVYSAEGQLRPMASYEFCVDIDGGDAGDGEMMHLWDCDGGRSEKWRISKIGSFANRDEDYDYCMHVHHKTDGQQLQTLNCDNENITKFILKSVDDGCGTACEPVADANGPYLEECTSFEGADIQLDGSGSTDPDGILEQYDWFINEQIVPGVTPTVTVPLGTYNVILEVKDDDGYTDSNQTSVKVRDSIAPVITCPADVTIECDASSDPNNTGWATASDDCDPSPAVSYSDVETQGSCPQEKTISRTWTAVDNCGNSSIQVQTIEVVDTTPPVITCNVQNPITPLDVPISFNATAVDNCGGTPAVMINTYDCYKFTKKGKKIDKAESCIVEVNGDQISILDSGGVGDNIAWTIEATDTCGNISHKQCKLLVVKPGN